jgi:hypothetical protein
MPTGITPSASGPSPKLKMPAIAVGSLRAGKSAQPFAGALHSMAFLAMGEWVTSNAARGVQAARYPPVSTAAALTGKFR